jgi:hypothetical protein
MPKCVSSGASLQCTFGVAPSSLIVLPVKRVDETTPGANIMDYIPITNIPPFGMCSAPTNPAVIATTAAALGVPTPAPCIPATAAPWTPGNPTVLLSSAPILTDDSKVMCIWGGSISVVAPGQMIVEAG